MKQQTWDYELTASRSDVSCRECGGYVSTQYARVCESCLDD